MAINASIFTRLSGFAGLIALVPSARMYSGKANQGTAVPFLVVNRATGPREGSLSGPVGLATPRYQIDSYADNYDEAKSIADQVRYALDAFNAGSASNETVKFGRVVDESDTMDNSTGALLHRCRVDVVITHREATS
jgi:hypothetical protein